MKKTSYIRKYGFSLQEIGAHMGLTRERVHQLFRTDPKRVTVALVEMKKARKGARS